MKLVTIVGARPQFVKAAVVSREIAKFSNNTDMPFLEIMIHTGQHYDANMSDIFFQEMDIPQPHYHLNVGGGTHGMATGRMLERIEESLLENRPDAVLVYGDTNSTLAGALAAAKLHIPVAHVEAGLRSFNMLMPEEVNRVLTDHVSKMLFCPTDVAISNLANEGITQSRAKDISVLNVGDVMYDALLYYKDKAKPSRKLIELLKGLHCGFYLATVHRAENTDDLGKLRNIMMALDQISKTIPVILPIHPRTSKILKSSSMEFSNIRFIDPVGYFDMIALLSACSGVFTDSGGLQKEAYWMSKYCVTLREETEWVELIEAKYNLLAGADFGSIMAAEESIKGKTLKDTPGFYGDGHAGEKIVAHLVESLA